VQPQNYLHLEKKNTEKNWYNGQSFCLVSHAYLSMKLMMSIKEEEEKELGILRRS
jgi:hypothetical protein